MIFYTIDNLKSNFLIGQQGLKIDQPSQTLDFNDPLFLRVIQRFLKLNFEIPRIHAI